MPNENIDRNSMHGYGAHVIHAVGIMHEVSAKL